MRKVTGSKAKLATTESGQAVLIVVLVMVVALTVALSVSLRSITNLRTAVEEENSQRAFFAAEAGIEQALRTSQTGLIIADKQIDPDRSNTKIRQVNISEVAGRQFVLNGANPVEKDDGADVWLVAHNADGSLNYGSAWSGNLTLFWGVAAASDCSSAAIEAILLSGTATSPTVTRYAFDPCGARRSQNNFSPSSSGSGSGVCATFPYSSRINSISSGIMVRLVSLYASSPICVEGSSELPVQGRRIESVGTSGTAERKVVLYQGYPKLPSELFQYSVFSPRN